MIKSMEEEFILGLTEENIMENGIMVNSMVKDSSLQKKD